MRVRCWVASIIVLLAFFCAVLFLHGPGFDSRMVYDSVGLLLENAHIFARHNPIDVMGIVPMRPVFMLSLYLNYRFGGMEPYYFRVVNAAILAAAGLALMILVNLILDIPGLGIPGDDSLKRYASLFAATVFVVHPLQGLVVLYVWQREAVLACLFYFSALAVYVAGRSGRLGKSSCWLPATGLVLLAGLLSKENVMTVPVIMLVAEATLFRQRLAQLPARAGVIAAVSVPAAVIALTVGYLLHSPDAAHEQGALYRLQMYFDESGIGPAQVAMTACRSVFGYLGMMVAPFIYKPELVTSMVVSQSPVIPAGTLPAIAGILSIAACGLALIRRTPLAAFSMLFFLVSPAPESLLIPQYLFCGYRAVLPMAAVCMLGAQLIMATASHLKSDKARYMTAACLLLIPAGLAMLTYRQATQWSPLSVWAGICDRLPHISKHVELTPYVDALGSYGQELSNAGDYKKAVEVLGRAAQVDDRPKSYKKTLALVNMGVAQIKGGDPAGGLESLESAVRFNPSEPWARYNLGVALVKQGRVDEGIGHLKKSIALNPADGAAHAYLGDLMTKAGDLGSAVGHYAAAIKADPLSAGLQTKLAAALEASRDMPRALEHYGRAVELAPKSAEYRFNHAKAMANLGMIDGALKEYTKALEINPEFAAAWANLGTLLLKSGSIQQAGQSLARAVALIPDNPDLRYQAGLAFALAGQSEAATTQFRKALEIKPDHKDASEALSGITGRNAPR